MGYIVCLITNDYTQAENREEYSEVHYLLHCDMSDTDNIREIINALKEESLDISAIISFVDPYCDVAAKLAKEYGIGCFTGEAMSLMQNKLKSRETLKDTPYNPKYQIIDRENRAEDDTIRRMLPVVVKYIESNGSKDVYFCDNMEAYKKYTEKLFNIYPNGTLLVEEFLNGPQVIVEVLTVNRKVNIVAIIEQEITFINEHFIITGYNLVINYSLDFYEKLRIAVEKIIAKYGLENGPSHLEMRIVNGNWKLVEINPRISGAGMNQLLHIGLGFNLVEETLKLAMHQRINITPKFRRHTYAEYVILDKQGVLRRITGREQVLESPGVKYVYVKPKKGRLLTPPTSLGGRYAYVIAIGESKREARNNAKTAAAKIVFHLDET